MQRLLRGYPQPHCQSFLVLVRDAETHDAFHRSVRVGQPRPASHLAHVALQWAPAERHCARPPVGRLRAWRGVWTKHQFGAVVGRALATNSCVLRSLPLVSVVLPIAVDLLCDIPLT